MPYGGLGSRARPIVIDRDAYRSRGPLDPVRGAALGVIAIITRATTHAFNSRVTTRGTLFFSLLLFSGFSVGPGAIVREKSRSR